MTQKISLGKNGKKKMFYVAIENMFPPSLHWYVYIGEELIFSWTDRSESYQTLINENAWPSNSDSSAGKLELYLLTGCFPTQELYIFETTLLVCKRGIKLTWYRWQTVEAQLTRRRVTKSRFNATWKAVNTVLKEKCHWWHSKLSFHSCKVCPH